MECPRIGQNAPKLPVGTRLEGVPLTSHGHWYFSGDTLAKIWPAIEAIAV